MAEDPKYVPARLPLLPQDIKWLSTEYYQEALSGFNLYEPLFWLPTISYRVGDFMFWPWMISTIASTLGCCYVAYFPHHTEYFDMPLDAHVVMGSALSFLVVMRTDASMNRWWEARCTWQTIKSSACNIAACTAPILRSPEATELVLMQLMAMLMACKAHLRGEKIVQEECGGRMDWLFVSKLNRSHNPPLMALKEVLSTVRSNLPDETAAGARKGMSISHYDETSQQLQEINQAFQNCLKIRDTPMVYTYVTTLRSFLIVWLLTLPFALVGKFGWLAVPVHSLLAFLFLSIEQMAVEIEQPFGNDANDIPMESYIMDAEKTIVEQIPGYRFDGSEELEESAAVGNAVGESEAVTTVRTLLVKSPFAPTEGEQEASRVRTIRASGEVTTSRRGLF